MNPTRNRCLVASVVLHGGLLAVLLLGPAFSTRPVDSVEVETLNLVPDLTKVIDEPFSRISAPGPSSVPSTPPPAKVESSRSDLPKAEPPPPSKPPAPNPQPPKKVEPVQPEKALEKARPSAAAVRKAAPSPTEPDGEGPLQPVTRPKKEIQVSSAKLKSATADSDRVKREREARVAREKREADAKLAELRDRQQRQAREYAENRRKATERIVGRLQQGLSTATDISMPGPGAESYANYFSVLKVIYQQAWDARKPSTATQLFAVVRAQITIARDGQVLDTNITDRSGDAAIDRSVEAALRDVRKVPAFPEGAKDQQRVITINFKVEGPTNT